VRIFEDFEAKELEPDVLEFKEKLFEIFEGEERKILKHGCKEISSERNPLSHYESISMKEVIELRKKLIRHLNNVINIVF
jgi:hypothetical protein